MHDPGLRHLVPGQQQNRRHALLRRHRSPATIHGGIPGPTEPRRRALPLPGLRPQHHPESQRTGGKTVDQLDQRTDRVDRHPPRRTHQRQAGGGLRLLRPTPHLRRPPRGLLRGGARHPLPDQSGPTLAPEDGAGALRLPRSMRGKRGGGPQLRRRCHADGELLLLRADHAGQAGGARHLRDARAAGHGRLQGRHRLLPGVDDPARVQTPTRPLLQDIQDQEGGGRRGHTHPRAQSQLHTDPGAGGRTRGAPRKNIRAPRTHGETSVSGVTAAVRDLETAGEGPLRMVWEVRETQLPVLRGEAGAQRGGRGADGQGGGGTGVVEQFPGVARRRGGKKGVARVDGY
mmetsp:Transcript_32326/g.74455  ORF Transcript_32326/g.74455 Transcript_32326/m.74455 type:complete len:345 (+) Transcript_32326:638-1672(+)